MLLCAKTIQKKKYAQAAPFASFFFTATETKKFKTISLSTLG